MSSTYIEKTEEEGLTLNSLRQASSVIDYKDSVLYCSITSAIGLVSAAS